LRITAAGLADVNKPYPIEPVELDPPRRGEVLVKMGAAGVCCSDLHFQKGEATVALTRSPGPRGLRDGRGGGGGRDPRHAGRPRHPVLNWATVPRATRQPHLCRLEATLRGLRQYFSEIRDGSGKEATEVLDR
jgi:hypothetical protein